MAKEHHDFGAIPASSTVTPYTRYMLSWPAPQTDVPLYHIPIDSNFYTSPSAAPGPDHATSAPSVWSLLCGPQCHYQTDATCCPQGWILGLCAMYHSVEAYILRWHCTSIGSLLLVRRSENFYFFWNLSVSITSIGVDTYEIPVLSGNSVWFARSGRRFVRRVSHKPNAKRCIATTIRTKFGKQYRA